jgi:glutathione synthase/RimK-type ligase-like ATP-grasp enzyme
MILVVSYPGEEHTDDVVQRLERAGHHVARIDLADFSTRASVSLSWDGGATSMCVHPTSGSPIDAGAARVGWWRRVRPFSVDPAITDPSMIAFAQSETSQAVNGMLDSLSCMWVNDRAADDAAHHKPLQWTVAQQVGLAIPRTLVTSDVDRAREFVQRIGVGKTVFKSFIAMTQSWRETRLVEQSDLDHLDAVRYAPVIFQEYIPGVDLRITVVGDQVFTSEIDARETTYPFDMRMVVGEARIKAVELPAVLTDRLLALQRRLGLAYGAIDMRRTVDDDYVFLEVNPAGQWLFTEERAGLPISQAMADMLGRLDVEPGARSIP